MLTIDEESFRDKYVSMRADLELADWKQGSSIDIKLLKCLTKESVILWAMIPIIMYIFGKYTGIHRQTKRIVLLSKFTIHRAPFCSFPGKYTYKHSKMPIILGDFVHSSFSPHYLN